MSKILNIATVATMLTLSASFAVAAPCNVGTTTNAATGKDTSSNVDGGSTTKVSPGAKGESPGTVGAMNNLGAAMKDDGSKKAPEGQPVKPGADNC
ncbi:hypothetical protein MKK65_26450 [Methylobacterium sp. J-001]|uniref:hypothetical protein n=1 Tax=Methylobacterium sp. J-001 TaxID=2836609 RepID=UPI001FBA94A5|nr:hypothetical protein [Methylobacterium sp. J-001]MCJ2120071.1 hypothetical protein [Methylobacterium sp. J-001]